MCKDLAWWSELGCIIASPAWTAGALQTLIGVLLAGVATVLALRRQLRHDRDLAAKQLAAEREVRTAERRSVAADTYGRFIYSWTDELYDMRPRDLGHLLLTSEEYPNHGAMLDAEREAELVFQPSAVAIDAWRDLSHTWRASRSVVIDDKLHAASEADLVDIGNAELAMLEPSIHRLRAMALEYIRWDGGQPPDFTGLNNDWRPVRPNDRDLYRSWMADTKTSFRTELQKHLRRPN
ncbi:hypothetical protein [Microbacterium sp. T2.11-28]|uniref:hypothetical protein n=1 Tax=Microbacterium sp. T2.11-28 TaxID=3041169 RepID=UPI00253F9231|nr:hypothetical protein [Microbacterium sp. T2.11-28]